MAGNGRALALNVRDLQMEERKKTFLLRQKKMCFSWQQNVLVLACVLFVK